MAGCPHILHSPSACLLSAHRCCFVIEENLTRANVKSQQLNFSSFKVEIDGSSHKGREEHDAARDRFLVAHGFTVWRIPNAHANQWPLKKILECQRPDDSDYYDAIKRANAKHTDAVTRAKGKKPPQRKSKEEFRERFVNQCVTITNKKQRQERERKEQYVRERQLRDDMRMSGQMPRIIRNYLNN